MKIAVLLAAVCILASCSGVSAVPDTPPPPGITRFNTGIMASDILRVPIAQDNVVCYVAVESNVMKSINCVKVTELPKQPREEQQLRKGN